MGDILSRLGEYDAASLAYERAFQLYDGVPRPVSAGREVDIAHVLNERGRIVQAQVGGREALTWYRGGSGSCQVYRQGRDLCGRTGSPPEKCARRAEIDKRPRPE